MTSYYETRSVAHVMQFQGFGKWEPRCAFRLVVEATDYVDGGWPIGHVWTVYGGTGVAPSKPWCKHCVKRVQHEVDEMVGTVLMNRGGAR